MGNNHNEHPQRTMRYWLARTLREMRGDESRADAIAYLRDRAGLTIVESTLARFEEEDPKKRTEGFPKDIDLIVVAYTAKWGDGQTPRTVWMRALLDWMEKGGAPYVGEITPEALAALDALELEERLRAATLRKQAGLESKAKPNAKDDEAQAQ